MKYFVIIIYCMTIIYPLDYNKTDTMLTVYFYISVCSSISTGEIREKRKRCKYIKGKYIEFY